MNHENGSQSGDTNLYGYVANDPINFVDPSGLIFQNLISGFTTPEQQATFGAAATVIGTVIAGVGVRTGNPWALLIGGAIGLEGGANLTHAVRNRGAQNPLNDIFNQIINPAEAAIPRPDRNRCSGDGQY